MMARLTSRELFMLHYPKFQDRVLSFTTENKTLLRVTGINVETLIAELNGFMFRAVPDIESANEFFYGKYSPRYAEGIMFHIEPVSGPMPACLAGLTLHAYRWNFFIPPNSPESKEIEEEDDRDTVEAELSDLALL